MKRFFSLISLNFIPQSQDFGLFLLRAGSGFGILLLHGWEKAQLFMGSGKWTAANEKDRLAELAKFADPLHIGSKFSLGLTAFAEVICAGLLIIGFGTRFAAFVLSIAMGTAFFVVHKGVLAGPGNGEKAALYLLAFFVILVAGPGRFSFDSNGGGGSGGEAH
jgi:putative oxidoreductase